MFHIFDVEFFGCRGSTPVSGAQYFKYGGNTTCIALYAGSHLLVIDCGTGLASLQSELFQTRRYSQADIFLTHVHWDHIQGIPFFGPFFNPACKFKFYGERRLERSLQDQLFSVMTAPVFPVTPEAFNAHIQYHEFLCGDAMDVKGVHISTCRLRHPDICTGFRFEWEGKSVCIIGDYEHGGEAPLAFSQGADVLIYDAQYTDAEYPAKAGWGHSTWREGCAFAAKCGAKRLYLTHHDPARSDRELDGMTLEAQAIFPQAYFAAEGTRFSL